MVELVGILCIFGVGKDLLKAWFYGKPFDLEDSVIDNLLGWVMLSRFNVRKIFTEGPQKAIGESLAPPTKTPDAIMNDVRKGRIERTVRSMPYVGEAYYWWFGAGHQKLEEQERKKGRIYGGP
jgi:hypothetical protein